MKTKLEAPVASTLTRRQDRLRSGKKFREPKFGLASYITQAKLPFTANLVGIGGDSAGRESYHFFYFSNLFIIPDPKSIRLKL